VEQSANQQRGVPRLSQSVANTSKKVDIVHGVQPTQVERTARAKAPRAERALPRVTTIARANPNRQI
jgi:hypothetical protein